MGTHQKPLLVLIVWRGAEAAPTYGHSGVKPTPLGVGYNPAKIVISKIDATFVEKCVIMIVSVGRQFKRNRKVTCLPTHCEGVKDLILDIP